MSAIWHDAKMPSFLAFGPSYSFHELAEIVAECPYAYAVAMAGMKEKRLRLGEKWYDRNEELAAIAWARHRPWWL